MLRRIAFAMFACLVVGPVSAQLEQVGNLDFETSATPEAQKHFLRGVAILHSFGWKQAITEFQAAQNTEPDFALAYWGESLCYNHPLAPEQDGDSPREVLKRLGPTREARLAKAPTEREKGFLSAVEDLWAEGDDWRARRVAYKDAMGQLHRAYPDDDEVITFYAVSLLSAARALEDETFRLEVRAGALAMDVFNRNPKHPGAAHYIIHSFDDPIHAPLALRAADAYAAIAPAVSHAIHMPTHIFIQHGIWDKVAHQNMRAHRVASGLWQPEDSMGDMAHSLDWGQYGFLQKGDYAEARNAITRFQEMVEMEGQDRARSGLAEARARYIIETEEWKVQPMPEDATEEELLANGMSAVRTGDLATAEDMVKRLAEKTSSTKEGSQEQKATRVMHQELQALVALAREEKDLAVKQLRDAVAIEETMRPPNGAAYPTKPSHELLGEVLLEIGQPKEAAESFEESLLRMPNRARSLLGAARAHAAAGDRNKAGERYAKLREIWNGHAELPGYREAEQFLASTDDR
ncbi:MAG TPA: hypothetical protein VLK65_00380 [Vicinamibacteria bacterium]|nr:hypothetical protein [Vicinamibacteria bacterium]